jgi:flagellar motility protein MotE (MotC chaperone)
MKKILGANWFVALVGSLIYLGTTLLCFSTAKFERVHRADDAAAGNNQYVGESWVFQNPDLDKLIDELKREKDALSVREQQLKDLEARLASERQEISVVTEAMGRVQKEFNDTILHIKQAEIPNSKKLAKTYAAMSPEGSANILKEQTDDEVLKVLFYLKPSETGPILEAFGRLGKTEAQRAGQFTERLRRSVESPPENPKP